MVIANYSSALEVVLLSFWLSCPRFAFPIAEKRETGREEVKVVVLDFFDALHQACGSQVGGKRDVFFFFLLAWTLEIDAIFAP